MAGQSEVCFATAGGIKGDRDNFFQKNIMTHFCNPDWQGNWVNSDQVFAGPFCKVPWDDVPF